jgi:hypothetical protein
MSVDSEVRDIIEDEIDSIKIALNYLLLRRKEEFEKVLQPLKCYRCSSLVGLDVFHNVNVSLIQSAFMFSISVVHKEQGGIMSHYKDFDLDTALEKLVEILKKGE